MVQSDYVESEADMDTLPAKDIATAFYQKYEPREVLGKGVSSTVRRAVLKETGASFAVKIIDVSQDLVDSDGLDLREQTMREINILRLVAGHENIIQLIDVFESVTYIFLVFELCTNGELFDHLNSVVTISEKRARKIMRQVMEALVHSHSKGVVHRDIKPENILLDQDFNVKVTDFGFAKVLQTGERLYEVCGTPGYLAPELLKAGMVERDECTGYGQEVDVWACGVVLYTLLVGFPPFWHRKQLMMIRQIMEAKYSFESAEWSDISKCAKDLISQMLVVEPTSRLNINQCLNHEFFHTNRSRRGSMAKISTEALPIAPVKSFNPRKVWRLLLTTVQFVVRIRRLKATPEPLSLKTASVSPYKMRMFRKVIDGAAFRVYGHWVKRGEGQNRAAMFELSPKMEVKRREFNREQEEVQERGGKCE
eukprot:TRINITY_DN13907_c0_g1_i1.p1 TRINITY_DN13907_c0_g1~~TRINITY_DN13907_c0_g1_i1.p1  ORF type:complete len:424 (+),score=134.92 TRINITY_DN13907_c0_g1_i1:165-1436(+)